MIVKISKTEVSSSTGKVRSVAHIALGSVVGPVCPRGRSGVRLIRDSSSIAIDARVCARAARYQQGLLAGALWSGQGNSTPPIESIAALW